MRPVGRQDGQALVELLGGLPLLLVLGLCVLQLMAVGFAAVLAHNAAEAAALSVAAGGDAEAAARHAIPRWSRAGMRVQVDGGAVRVSLRPPSPIPAVARGLEIEARAAVALP